MARVKLKFSLQELVGRTWLGRMLRASRERCWICRKRDPLKRALAIDHCHRSGRVRGLLCTRCNQVLGRMGDDPDLFRRSAAYLEKARGEYPFDAASADAETLATVEGDWNKFAADSGWSERRLSEALDVLSLELP